MKQEEVIDKCVDKLLKLSPEELASKMICDYKDDNKFGIISENINNDSPYNNSSKQMNIGSNVQPL